MPVERKIEDIKIYFQTGGTTYNVDFPFENILKKYKGFELDLKQLMKFAPVVQKSSAWVHAMKPQPSSISWPLVAENQPFQLDDIEGHYILEFTGIVMSNKGSFTDGSCTDFEGIFMKLIAPRFVRLKKVQVGSDSELKRIDILPRF